MRRKDGVKGTHVRKQMKARKKKTQGSGGAPYRKRREYKTENSRDQSKKWRWGEGD